MMLQNKQRPPPTGGRGQRKMILYTNNYSTGSIQKSLRLWLLVLHFLDIQILDVSSTNP